jgi:prophage tail gpP-like protein
VIGKPNYDQEPQFTFFMPKKDSRRSGESTVQGMGVRRSTANRYSRIICVGAGVGTDANYGHAVASHYGEAKNNPNTPEGDGDDFSAPKRLIIQRPVKSSAEARELAEREMAQRDAGGDELTVRCAGFGQQFDGGYSTQFAPDLIASVEDERTKTKGSYYITSCTYRDARKGRETLMRLVRSGAEITNSGGE